MCSLMYAACNAHALCYIFICGLPISTIFFHIIPQKALFKKKKVMEREMCVLIFSSNFV